MRNWVSFLFLILGIVLGASAAYAGSPTYSSIAEGIDTASGQGVGAVNLGDFTGYYQDYTFIIRNKSAKTFTHDFDYRSGVVDSASIYFKEAPITVVIRKNDLCAVVEVRRVSVGEGGFLDESKSEFKLVTRPSDCESNRPEMASSAAELFRLPLASNNFFKAEWFKWSHGLKKCPTQCTNPSLPLGSLLKNVTFVPSNGKPGFQASLVENAAIDLGRGDFLRVAATSTISFNYVSIDLATTNVTARLRQLKLPLNAGRLSNDVLTLFMEPGSGFEAANLNIDASKDRIEITDGFVKGAAGANSTILISNGPGVHPSSITLARAQAELNSINLLVQGGQVSFSASSGTFDASVMHADLQLGRALRVELGATNLKLSFLCPTGSPADCKPVQILPNKPVVTIGVISPLTLSSQSGSYDLAGNAGLIRLDRGELTTGELQLDSRNTKAPVVGNITSVNLDVSAQTIRLDAGFQLEALSGKLAGEDLMLSAQDGLPSGTLRLRAEIASFRGEGIGGIATVRGQATMTANLKRDPNTDVHILDGRIQAQAVATSDTGNTSASVLLTDLDLIHGDGSARFSLTIPNLEYSRFFTGQKQREDIPLAHVDVTIHEQTLSAKLVDALKFENRRVTIRNGKWSIEPTQVHVNVLLTISSPELVYAQVEPFTGGTLCTSKVNLPFANYSANFDINVRLDGGKFGLSSSPFVISPYPQPEIDGKACKKAITIVCGLGGAVLGPIGAIGAAYLCHDELDKGQQALQDNLNDIVAKGIGSLRFDVST